MKLVYLEWEDATTWNDGWKDREEIDNYLKESRYVIRETGFLWKESKKEIVLISRHLPESGEYKEQWAVVHRIPRAWIRKRIDLTKHLLRKPK